MTLLIPTLKVLKEMAHFHLGLLVYWIANTIRYQPKQVGINDDWKAIRRKVDILEHTDPSIGQQKSGNFYFVGDK